MSHSHGEARGYRSSVELNTWAHMWQRCENPKNAQFKNYGARGIKVCSRWRRFDLFLRDMGRRPSAKMSLDRRNNDKGYSPENCRWATSAQQSTNKRISRFLTFDGKKQTISQWASESGIKRTTVAQRIRKGWSTSEALTIPPLSNGYLGPVVLRARGVVR